MLDEIRDLLTSILMLGARGKHLTERSELLGGIPEFDSMAVVSVITVLEEHYDLEFDDEDITAESFATLGALCKLIERKLAEQ